MIFVRFVCAIQILLCLLLSFVCHCAGEEEAAYSSGSECCEDRNVLTVYNKKKV